MVPSLGSINTRNMQLMAGHGNAMYKGSFNWRLTFTIVGAARSDLVRPAEPEISPVRSPVMPGGLFAIGRR